MLPLLETFPETQHVPGASTNQLIVTFPLNIASPPLSPALSITAPVHVRVPSVDSPLHVRDPSVASPVHVKVAIVKAPAALRAICKYDEALVSRRGA